MERTTDRAPDRAAGFAGVDAELLAELEPALTPLELARGEVLMRRGDAADHVYLVRHGRLAVEGPEGGAAPPLAVLGAGELVGEVALFAGGARSATVRALEDCALSRATRADLERVLEGRPERLARFIDTIRRRLWRSQLAGYLRSLLGALDTELLAELESDVEFRTLDSGCVLFERGDPADAVFFVLSGRLRVLHELDPERWLREVGAGETLGEMALLADEKRSATVVAVRDSQLARLPRAAFDALLQRRPGVLRGIAATLVGRLRSRDAVAPRLRSAERTLAIVPGGAGAEAEEFTRRLAEALAKHGTVLRLDARAVDEALARPGIAQSAAGEPASLRLVQWLNERELAHRFVLYQTDALHPAWTERALRQADHVLFVADAAASPEPGALERAITERWRDARPPRSSLVLLRASSSGEPRGTAAFLDVRSVTRHYHVRSDSSEDYARLARWLTGSGVGLVLGGGGARGFAHLGVLRALGEAGVPIDWVGGTSIGAIVAAGVAQGLSPAEAHALCREHFSSLFDPTFPLVSLLAGRRIRARLEAVLGARQIEDLQLPFLCVSTNLSRAEQAVHERGPLVQAIRASISLPGILPPVAMGADLHVDGALVNNLPIDVIAARPEVGAVLAVDVSPEVELRAPADLAAELSGWRLLGQRLNPFGSRTEVPGIAHLLTRSSVVGSLLAARERGTAAAASLYLRVPVADLRLLAFERVDEIAERGYESTRELVRDWWAGRSARIS